MFAYRFFLVRVCSHFYGLVASGFVGGTEETGNSGSESGGKQDALCELVGGGGA